MAKLLTSRSYRGNPATARDTLGPARQIILPPKP
jgi:hypothetical protein